MNAIAIPRASARPRRLVRNALVLIAVAFLLVFLLLPLAVVFAEGLRQGIATYLASIAQPEARASILLTLLVAGIAVPLNLVFGVTAAWLMARFQFPGKALLGAIIDIPFSVSPVISGLIYVLLFGRAG